MKDILTEMLTGCKGAIRAISKLYLLPATIHEGDNVEGMHKTIIGGAMITPESVVLPTNEGYSEMWECEVIIIPIRKFSGLINKDRHAFDGHRIDQVLCGRGLDSEFWGECYFGDDNRKETDLGY